MENDPARMYPLFPKEQGQQYCDLLSDLEIQSGVVHPKANTCARKPATLASHGGFISEAKLKLIFAATAVTLIAATSAHADCKSEVDVIMQGMMHAGPYHMTMSSDAGGKTTKMEADVILPTAEHIRMDQMEMVILPQGSWMKRGDKWMAAPGPMGANMLNAMMSSLKDTRSNFVCGSNESFDGQSYPVYKYDSAGDAMGIKTSSHITLYKGDNGLPAGIIVDGTAMGTHSVSTQHIKYDPSITIEPPQ